MSFFASGSSRSLAFGFLFIFPIVTYSSAAFADAQQLVDQIHDSVEQSLQIEEQQSNRTIDTIKKEAQGVQQTLITIAAEQEKNERQVDPDQAVRASLAGFPAGAALESIAAESFLRARLLELNLVEPTPVNGKQPYYLIDPSQKPGKTDVGAEQLDVYMRLFCNPRARGGTMMLLSRDPNDSSNVLPFGTKYSGAYLGCGALLKATGKSAALDTRAASRDSLLGVVPSALWSKPASQLEQKDKDLIAKHEQMIGLPQNTPHLFFYPETFPTMPANPQDPATNTHPMAVAYTGALMMALQFLTGAPADKFPLGQLNTESGAKAYLAYQANISRKMLASYVFIKLFSERIGTLNEDVASETADLILSKLEEAGADATLWARAQNISKRKNLSLAEYKHILMYEMMMSPGYLERINRLSEANLKREMTMLNAWQVAQMREINDWLGILAAIEAVKQERSGTAG